MIFVRGIPQAKAKMKRTKREFDKRFAKKVFLSAQYVHISITSLTAVWQGTSLANWQWNMGRAASGVIKARGKSIKPGHTNKMALGAEPKRATNQAIADASFRKMSFKDPYNTFVLANNDPKIGMMEAGLLPVPARSRTQDMVKITKQGVIDYMRSLRV